MTEECEEYLVNINMDDTISRCLIYNKFFRNGKAAKDLLWKVHPTSGDGGIYHESGVLRRIATTDQEVHKIGCDIAAFQNSRVIGKKKDKWKQEEHQKYYCGFSSGSLEELEFENDYYKIKFTLLPEHGVESHVDVMVEVKGETQDDRDYGRSEASLALAEVFGVPVPYRCECDTNDVLHPFKRFGCDCLVANYKNDLTDEEYIAGTFVE